MEVPYSQRLKFKLLVVGEMGVGKTCLIERYVNNTFILHTMSTVQADLNRKRTQINGRRVELIIWDSPGQTVHQNITVQAIRNSDAVIIVYDVTNRRTYESLPVWIQKVDMYAPDAKKILVGNKCEPDTERQVSYEEGRRFGENTGLTLMEVSVKIPQHVDEMFTVISERVVEERLRVDQNNVANMESARVENINIEEPTQPSNSSGCGC